MPAMNKLSTYRTTWTQDGENIVVCYVSTNIVKASADTVTLDSGGWRTVTTKRKMTQAARQFGLGFSVFQRKGDWYVVRFARDETGSITWEGAHTFPFEDGMTFPRGTVQKAA